MWSNAICWSPFCWQQDNEDKTVNYYYYFFFIIIIIIIIIFTIIIIILWIKVLSYIMYTRVWYRF